MAKMRGRDAVPALRPGSAEHQLGMKPGTMPSWCLAFPVAAKE